jgi:polyisoprenoid-binding protein YceI
MCPLGRVVATPFWQIYMKYPLICALATIASLTSGREVVATPVRQELARNSSQITFGVESPNPSLRMNGSFQDFKGRFELNSSRVTDSTLELTLNLASVSLPPEQLMQALFVQGIITRVAPRPNTFRSSRFEHTSGSSYLLHGNYSWMNRLKSVSVPVTILEATPTRTRMQLFLEGAFIGRNVPKQFEGLAASAKGTEGWTKAVLVFTPAG